MRARKSRFYQLFTLSKGAGAGIQGEFGIGLLSVRTVGGTLTMTPPGTDQRAYQMLMNKGEPRYTVSPRRVLFAERGTEVKISPLLEGIRGLSGEKIQRYLASELRDRIRNSQVRVYAELYLIEPADDCAGPKQTYSPSDRMRGFRPARRTYQYDQTKPRLQARTLPKTFDSDQLAGSRLAKPNP